MVSAARRRIVFKAIRAAILKGNEIEYWTLRMYDQQAAGVLDDNQVEELEALIDAYYSAQEAEEEEMPDLSTMTKAELIDYANEHGIEVSESWTKAEIIDAINA